MMAVDAPPAVDAVVVSAARLPTSPADAAFSIVNVDPAALQTFDRVDDIIKTSPSVSLFRRGSSAGANPTVQGLSLRSLAPSGAGRALVTLDGVPQNDAFGNWVIWTSLTPEALSGVSIVRGAGAGPYGAGALTGVVALDEKSAVTGGLIGDVSASDLGARRVALAGSDKVGSVQLFATGATESGDHWIPVRQRRGAADSDLTLEDWSTSGKAVIPVGTAALTAHAGAFREARGSGLVGVNSATSGQDAALTLTTAARSQEPGLEAAGLAAPQRSVQFLRLGVRRPLYRHPGQFRVQNPGHGLGDQCRSAQDGRLGQRGAGFDLRAAGGEESEKSSFVNGAYTKGRVAGGDTLIYGVYAEGAWRSGAWLLTGGARIDEWSTTHGHRIETTLATGAVTLNPVIANKSGSVPTARAGIRRDFGPVYLRTAGYAGFRVPSLNELYRPFRVGNNITEANENLLPEKLYGGEVAVGRTKDR